MGVTIKKIAELAGVSAGTVDRALHNRPGIDPELAKRILLIAKKLDYRPNHAAKALSDQKKVRTIAVMLHARGNAFYQEILRGMEEAEYAYRDYNIRLDIRLLKGYDIPAQITMLREIVASDAEGLIITPIADKRVTEQFNELVQKQIPVVALNTDLPSDSKLCSVGANYYGCGQLAAELFGMMNPKSTPASVAVVAGSLKQSGHKQRIDGLVDTLNKDYPHISCDTILLNDDDNDISRVRVESLMESNSELDGIFFCAGGISGGLDAIRQANLPRPLQIITVDETEPVISALQQGIVCATISQRPFEQGYRAVQMICEHLIWGSKIQGKRIVMRNEIKLRHHFESNYQEE